MSLALTERQTRDIEALCQIAKENGVLMSLRELIGLAAIDGSELELERAFMADSTLRSKFLLESGYVLDRFGNTAAAKLEAVAEEEARRERARINIEKATRFGRLLVRGSVLVSVSGTNSYLSAAAREDIDFFCVTKSNGMWLFILKALMLARIHRMANKDVPELCFSCVMDQRRAEREFRDRQNPIFARDALTAKLIGGEAAYRSLLLAAPWMASYFPVFYALKLRETSENGRESKSTEMAEGAIRRHSLLNYFLYLTLGSFLRMKSWALNRRLTKAGKHSAIFITKVEPGYYVYESNRYRMLRRMYDEFEVDR